MTDNIIDILAGIALALIFFFFTWFLFLLEI